MAVFEPFSFDAAARYTYDPVLQISPMSSPTSYAPIPRRSSHAIADLAYQFSQHTLSHPPSIINPASTFDAPPPTQAPEDLPTRSWSPPCNAYRRMSASAIRAQRQQNIRLLADASHVQQLSALVERMVESGEQCRVHSSSSSLASLSAAASPSLDGDFGEMSVVDEPAAMEDFKPRELRYRRSGDLVGTPATVPCVRRDIKVRKQRRTKSGSSK